MNSTFNFGESIAKPKKFRKILWSLPKRFHAKITVIEEMKDIAQGKGEKSRNLALKSIEEEIDDSEDKDESEDEDEDDDEDEDLTFIANEVIKLFQYRKKDKDKPPRKSKSSKKGKNEKPLIQCHECKGFCHIRIECPNYLMKEKTKNSKGKGLVTT